MADPVAPNDGKSTVQLECTPDTFTPLLDLRVRWLDREADLHLLGELWLKHGVSMTEKDWQGVFDQGFRYCGIVENGVVVAVAAVWTYSPTAWELAAVQTVEARRGRGYSKAVCSFVTAYILNNGRLATCSTRADNVAMLRVAAALGFRPASPLPATPGR